MNNYADLITTMNSAKEGKYILPAGINKEMLERTYLQITGKEIQCGNLQGDSAVYVVNNAKFYHGSITRHPSMLGAVAL